ncbi:ClpP/crotonase [Zopfia rhizophila CBS 207.26]|uniref:ClpP/crotonase n=1 Tax=Zopfia rhizophila CBS 207.26 TaxID=1314779 RepID=A0A6A6DDZ4_9PEZI|nr:ClpP/crotonase [Zopfia rhizophila CBS 207.26]
MSTPNHLFTVPVPESGPHPGGSITCSEPEANVYLLVFASPPDNRLTTAFCTAMLTALDVIEFGYRPGVVITTSSILKFYSNGLDLEHAQSTPGFWTDALYTLWRRLLTYPMPTISLMNGHTFAGGLMLAMHHDYRVFNPARGFACLNELDFGAALKPPMSSIFRQKLAPATYRTLVLEARRFAGPAALDAGIVDALGSLPEALALVRDRGLTAKGTTGVYGILKMEMYRESLALLAAAGFEAEEKRAMALVTEDEERRERGLKWIEAWPRLSGIARLRC